MTMRLPVVGVRPLRQEPVAGRSAAPRVVLARPAVLVTSHDGDVDALRFALALVRAASVRGDGVAVCLEAGRASGAFDALRAAGASSLVAWRSQAGAESLEADLAAAPPDALVVCVGEELAERFAGLLTVAIGEGFPDADVQLAGASEAVASAIGDGWTRIGAAAQR
jgi:hypothetical protein